MQLGSIDFNRLGLTRIVSFEQDRPSPVMDL